MYSSPGTAERSRSTSPTSRRERVRSGAAPEQLAISNDATLGLGQPIRHSCRLPDTGAKCVIAKSPTFPASPFLRAELRHGRVRHAERSARRYADEIQIDAHEVVVSAET